MREAAFPQLPIWLRAEHGGDLSAAQLAYPQAPEPWLDLSTGINPYSYPCTDVPPGCLTKLPDASELLALEAAAAKAYGAPAHAQIVAAPGTQAIINWLPRLRPARTAGILGFTYSEFARCWAANGAAVTIAAEPAALQHRDVAIIVNPNNPDGRLVSVRELLGLAEALDAHGSLLIIDEAFIDFELGASIVSRMPERGMLVLRSFGKTFGLPGLRLGFAIAPATIAVKLRAALGPWPVSGPAITIGTRALPDSEWLAAARQRLEPDIAAVDAILAAAGFEFVGGTTLFRLVAHNKAQFIYQQLAHAGILSRRFAARPNWLRFGIPASRADRARLRTALGLGPHHSTIDLA
jgi:cobalamin biosynthetic protein CobC